ncbi:MAG: ATP-binding domain-containing protein [Proteobacteria bacterium]|nr:ATP-binding domain-containing protein [Pseudomonadota bacterium]
MSLDNEVKDLLEHEEKCFKGIADSITEQISQAEERLFTESARAQDLTSELVATRRDVEKQMLASDEAVSHGIRDLKKEELETLEFLQDKPYFAHLILDEDDGRKIEFFLGSASNSECRIIDWRKAPISKLYYEYKEGEDYYEEIQGTERSGKIRLRNKVDIEKKTLQQITCRHGSFTLTAEGWQILSANNGKSSSKTRNYSKLPDVLSLITVDQFQTITEDAKTAILIQGVAGSGKTTVALHRLSWLLHADNSDLKPEEAIIIVRSPALQVYISGGQDSLDLRGVKVFTYREWCNSILIKELPTEFSSNNKVRRPNHITPPTFRRILSSLPLLKCYEEKLKADTSCNIMDALVETLRDTRKILTQEDVFLIDAESLNDTAEYLKRQFAEKIIDPAADGLLMLGIKLTKGQFYLNKSGSAQYRHIVVDEVQDFSAAELGSIISGVKSLDQLTLVGDSHQAIDSEGSFLGWEKLRKHWNFSSELSRFVSLNVSHRSTLPIMRLADYVSGSQRTESGKPGNPPLWFHCFDEDQGVTEAIGWLTRINQKFPNSLTVVVCRNLKEANFVYGLLKPSFQHSVRLGDDKSFSFEEGIIVTSVAMIKGLEFPHVLIWNPNASHYQDTSHHRNLLYVAITRAEDHLCLITWGDKSPILPSIHSKLVRGYDKEQEAKEAQIEAQARERD